MLRGHNTVCPAVSFSRNNGHLWDCGLSESIQNFSPVTDDSAVLLRNSGKKTGHIFKSDQRNVEGIAKTDKTGSFIRGIDVQNAGKIIGLISDYSRRLAVEPPEPYDNILGVLLLDFKKIIIIQHLPDNIPYIIRLIRISRNREIQIRTDSAGKIGSVFFRRILHIVIRHERQQLPDQRQCLFFVFGGEVGHSAESIVRFGPS